MNRRPALIQLIPSRVGFSISFLLPPSADFILDSASTSSLRIKLLKSKVLKTIPTSLLQLIQRTADRVARGAGSAFRVVAGTESIDSAIKNFNSDSDVQSNDNDQLKADSSETRSARSGDLSLVKILFVKLLSLLSSLSVGKTFLSRYLFMTISFLLVIAFTDRMRTIAQHLKLFSLCIIFHCTISFALFNL